MASLADYDGELQDDDTVIVWHGKKLKPEPWTGQLDSVLGVVVGEFTPRERGAQPGRAASTPIPQAWSGMPRSS